MQRLRVIIVNGLIGFMPMMLNAQRATQVVADASNPQFDQARALIRKVMSEQVLGEKGIMGASVAVAKGGKILWEEGFGYANREKMLRATPDTVFPVACSSFTPDGIMKLVEDGKIRLDKPINDYLRPDKLTAPNGDASGATVRRILSHTAGLGYYYRYVFETETSSFDEAMKHYGFLMHKPGDRYVFSSLGYEALGSAIEKVSGMSYADYMRQKIYLPLGMTHTAVVSGPTIGLGLDAYAAVRYDENLQPLRFYNFGDRAGAASASSSVHDMIRYAMFHLKDHLHDQKPILKDATIDAMHKVEIQDTPDWGFGLGWMAEEDHGYKVTASGGGTRSVETVLDMYPSEDLAIVVLSSSTMAAVAEFGDQVRDKILEAVIPTYAAAEAEAENKRKAAPQKAKPPVIVAPPELVGKWVGTVRTWQEAIPFTLVIKSTSDVHAKLGSQPEVLLHNVRFNDGYFAARFDGPIPTPDANRENSVLILDAKLRIGTLSGSVVARTDDYALPSYIELKKVVN